MSLFDLKRTPTESTCTSSVCSNSSPTCSSKTFNERTKKVMDEPFSFPQPIFKGCLKFVNVAIHNPASGRHIKSANVLYSPASKLGYYIRRGIQKALFGTVVHAIIVRRIIQKNRVEWVITDMECAIKIIDQSKISCLDDFGENPLKEVAAMQYISNIYKCDTCEIITPVEVLADCNNLYVILPFCENGELFDRLERKGKFDENESRYWFRQICKGIQRLHEAGVCHRDISLENILIRKDGTCHIIDLGASLRVPCYKSHSENNVMIMPQGRAGKNYYLAPEIYKNESPFNPYSVDIWSAGALLFAMLTGSPPCDKPCYSDHCFRWLASGRINDMTRGWGMELSPKVINLLEGMLCVNLDTRFSLEDVINHPWMVEDFDNDSVPRPPHSSFCSLR